MILHHAENYSAWGKPAELKPGFVVGVYGTTEVEALSDVTSC
jgi:hypothetical protein